MWVPRHEEIDENKKVDELARVGSCTKFTGPEPFWGWSTYRRLKEWTANKTYETWEQKHELRQSKEVIKLFQSEKTKLRAKQAEA